MDQSNYSRILSLAAQAKALQRAMEQSLGENLTPFSRYDSYVVFGRKYNLLASQAVAVLPELKIPTYDLDRVDDAGLAWTTKRQFFDLFYSDIAMLAGLLESHRSFSEAKTVELKDFFESSLRRAVFAVPDNEKALQDIVEQLLIGRGFRKPLDYDRETGRVKYAGKEFIPDFIFKPASMFIEVKLVKTPDKAKNVIDEINADILAYKSEYSKGMFIVYDVGTIRDTQEFVGSIEQQMDISVCLVKH